MSAEATHGAPVSPGADPVERLLADLNPPQREAVTHGEGPLLVLAGAGSGKTRVLTHRIAWLLATGRARPMEILAITFTNKAANEMRERVAALVGGISRAMWVMTFHSACARILRAEAPRLGYKRAFTIYDEADSVRMVKRCLEELELDPKRYPPRSMKAAISAAKNQLTDAADYATTAATDREQAIADVYNLYERRMVEASAMDFDDLLVRTVNLLELFADVREKYRRIFRWVLVDEYQDTNRAQYRLLQLLTEEHRNLTWSVTISRAVYSFRGADIRNILEFERDFPDATTVLLEQNYRSTQTVLDAANGLIAHNESQKPKHLWTDGARGEPIVIGEFDDEHAEARYVASEINRLVEEGYSRDSDRGLLPDERPEPGARGHAGALRDPLPGDRRDQVLRARRDQGRRRLPAAAREPGRRDLVLAGSSTRRGAGSASRPRRGSSRTRTRSASTCSTCSPTRRRSPRSDRRRCAR